MALSTISSNASLEIWRQEDSGRFVITIELTLLWKFYLFFFVFVWSYYEYRGGISCKFFSHLQPFPFCVGVALGVENRGWVFALN